MGIGLLDITYVTFLPHKCPSLTSGWGILTKKKVQKCFFACSIHGFASRSTNWWHFQSPQPYSYYFVLVVHRYMKWYMWLWKYCRVITYTIPKLFGSLWLRYIFFILVFKVWNPNFGFHLDKNTELLVCSLIR